MNRFLCIHGHFYQPPRENPWLEAIETQDSAFPYHDWNQRITVECYASNAVSRILDDKMRIIDILNNYSKMSYDIGPTLLQWLEKNASETYSAIIEADRQSARMHSGHGGAIAQAYNHMIMPLASDRDKITQVLWGIRDFSHRFGHDPEGMWLPETAADIETLDIMASMGIRFTILAPHQARRVRKKGAKNWTDVSGAKIDPKLTYSCNLPSGRKISIFFYDGPISRAVAFEKLLNSGENFANRLLGGFSDSQDRQLMHIATDGESYGHHHRFGEMALSYAINRIESKKLARITNYGEFLELNPPKYEVEIYPNTSWSCSHGIERWKNDCGCNSGANPKWSQGWRAPLREALDRLRDEIAQGYERMGAEIFRDPWAARNDYIGVILDRSDPSVERFLDKHSSKRLTRNQKVIAWKLLELQRHSMLMYTSCGWFFDDISGIETVQILEYAGRAIQLSREVLGVDLEPAFTARLAAAKSNVPSHGDGTRIYENLVKPATLDLQKVAAHYAINSVFEDYPERAAIYCYNVHRTDHQKLQAGNSVLVTGKCLITSKVTSESDRLSYCVLYMGNHDINCGVRKFVGSSAYADMKREVRKSFETGSFADIVRLLDTYFGTSSYSLKDLFRDEQRSILDILITETLVSFEDSYRRMFEGNRLLMGFLKDVGVPVPKAFYTAAEFVLNLDLQRQIETDLDGELISEILKEFGRWNVSIDKADIEFALKNKLADAGESLFGNPTDADAVNGLSAMVESALALPIRHNFWHPQNVYFRLAKNVYPEFAAKAAKGDSEAMSWVEGFRSLGERLNFNLDSVLRKA